MKIIKYKFCSTIESDTGESKPSFMDKEIRCSEMYLQSNIAVAEQEAFNGEYTVEDDGTPEPAVEPTTDEILNALLGV